jgi:signal transduction histidine kinase
VTTKPLTLPTKIDMDRFISVHAHDMRTPFNHITGFSKMLLNTLSDAPLNEMQKEDLGTVYRSGMRALAIINGLVDMSRLGRSEKDFSPTYIETQSLMDRGLAQWKKFHPGTETETLVRNLVTSASMYADEQMLQQVIAGFISYVALFCESKATVNVTVEEEGKQFLFTFASSGLKARMPSELDLEMLGYTYRAFVELNGGEIKRAEENDNGAVIQFTLPKK